MFHVYILRCADNSLYVGIAEKLRRRIDRHNAKKGAGWTAARLPAVLIYSELFDTLEQATGREIQLKGWSRAKKESLISGNSSRLKSLSRCRSLHGMPV